MAPFSDEYLYGEIANKVSLCQVCAVDGSVN